MKKNQKTCLEPNRKILVAMSGGVDSSVATALLVSQGCDVTGMFAVNYDEDGCWHNDYQDALRVCAHLGIPLLRWDFQKEYKDMVLDYMYKEYEAGRTPNPDIMCNKFVKFGVWLDKARELGFDKIATGHYAKVSRNTYHVTPEDKTNMVVCDKCYVLRVPKDENKDQTYFLHQLTQEQLKYVLFPLGEYTKDEVRKLAKKFDLPTADKEESMGICFVGEVSMKEFLEGKISAIGGPASGWKDKIKKGDVVMSDGTKIGEHDGLAFYTIGQRHMGIKNYKLRIKNTDSRPLFVVGKDFEKNQLIVGYEDDPLLFSKEIEVENIHWIGQEPIFPLKCKVRLRHRQTMQNAECRLQNGILIVKFEEKQRAITPGQFAVFYLKDECLGGGVVT